MSVIELQNSLIQFIKGIQDEKTLQELHDSFLRRPNPSKEFNENELIKSILEKSKTEINSGQFKSHDQMTQDTTEWLKNL